MEGEVEEEGMSEVRGGSARCGDRRAACGPSRVVAPRQEWAGRAGAALQV